MSDSTTASPSSAQHEVNLRLTQDDKLGLYRLMARIRAFEQTSLRAYNSGKMGGFLHLYIGQESVAVGTISLLGKNDHIITAYRDHAHALGVGMTMEECMAELYGKATGCSKGKGGSMHYFEPSKNYWGGHGIVAGQTPLGLGLAFGLKYQSIPGVVLCYLGDGAVNQGAFHESLNIAALWSLPVIYVIENNGYSMGTSQRRSSSYPSCLAERAEGYDISWDQFNGTDLYEVRARTHAAIERARVEQKPSILEITTYRWEGHSVADAMKTVYRTKEEIERHQRENDPIMVWKQHLLDEGVASEDQIKLIDREARQEADASADFADASPYPDPASIFEDVYWATDQKTAVPAGRHFFND